MLANLDYRHVVAFYVALLISIFYSRNMHYVPLSDDVWHHLGITWENRAGNYTVYYDGNVIGSGTSLHPGLILEGQGVLTLGQSQGTPGGTFESSQAYLGKLSAFNIWDYIFPEEKIRAASIGVKCESTDGNIATWPDFAEGNNYFVSSSYWNILSDCSHIGKLECFKNFFYILLPREGVL